MNLLERLLAEVQFGVLGQCCWPLSGLKDVEKQDATCCRLQYPPQVLLPVLVAALALEHQAFGHH